MKPVIIIAIAFVLLIPTNAFAQYTGNVGSGGITLEEALEIQRRNITNQSSGQIPSWVTNIFIWYAEDKIGESELLNALQYLIKEGILVIPAEQTQNCDSSYPDVCIAHYPPDLDCGEIGYSNFVVTGDDPHGFDGDKDGIGCEVGSQSSEGPENAGASKTEIQEITENFRVSLGTYSAFILEYGISGGSVQDVFTDRDDFSLSVIIDSVSDGIITLDLPRQIIGAEKQDGSDDTFIVLIDGIEVAYQESEFDFVSRLITINFEQGDSEIKILGTYIA